MIASSVHCTWWDEVDDEPAACPHCGGAAEVYNLAEWWDKVGRALRGRHVADFDEIADFARGRCFTEWADLEAAWLSGTD